MMIPTEEQLVEALLRTTAKLHFALQRKNPYGDSTTEQEHGEAVLEEWLETVDGDTFIVDDFRSDLADQVRSLLQACEDVRRTGDAELRRHARQGS